MRWLSLVLGFAVASLCACRDCPEPVFGETMLEPEWVLVRPGSFRMGATDPGRDAYPPMEVTLTRPFWIQTSEVTRAEGTRVAEAFFATYNDIGMPPEPQSSKSIPELGSGEEWQAAPEALPFVFALRHANSVSLLEGYEPCYALHECEPPTGLFLREWYRHGCAVHAAATSDPDCRGYRLPTEAEFEWAARARGRSDCQTPSRCMNREAVTRGTRLSEAPRIDYSNYTHIATQCPNELGLYDMIGNVAEWTSDLRQAQEPYFYDSPLTDPTRPVPDYVITNTGGLAPPEGQQADVLAYLDWIPQPIARGGDSSLNGNQIAPYTSVTGAERSQYGWRLVRTAFELMEE